VLDCNDGRISRYFVHETPQPGIPPAKINRVEVYWHSVTYRTVIIYIAFLFAIALGVTYVIAPGAIVGLFERVDHVFNGSGDAPAAVNPGQIRFVNLDGDVQIKKVNSVRWEQADYRTTLEKGDLIQTSDNGAARIAFPDGTNYTVKGATLVTVEENSVDRNHATKVGVQVSTGAVDLTTGTWTSPSSKAVISFNDAHASVEQNSRATVHTDAARNEGEITVSAGSAEVRQGDQQVHLDTWQRAQVARGTAIQKSNVLAPPDLVAPINFSPLIFPEPKEAAIHFEWKPAAEAASYVLRVSSTSTFNKVAVERKVTATGADITGIDTGDYFWNVTAIDSNKHESEPSNTYKFTVVSQGKGQEMALEVEQTVLHGSVVEVIGRTEPGAALIINGQAVADITADGKFRFFTDQLARGSQTILITGQNRRGGTATKRIPIVIP
jgi:hypothetical protein